MVRIGSCSMRRKFKWTDKQLERLECVKDVLQEWNAYLPLTLRQVYYQLVSKEIIENKISKYTMLSQLLKWARIDGKIPWYSMEDRGRAIHIGGGYSSKEDFISSELDSFLCGYYRDLMTDQDKFIEIWIEKDALSSIFSKISKAYCISTVVCKGFSSVTFLNNYKNRCSGEIAAGKKPVMLYFGDFDPSGYEMLPAMEKTLLDEMGSYGIRFTRVALTKDDIDEYALPNDPSAVKISDTRYQKFVDTHGSYAVELDALPPDILEKKIQTAIESEIDMSIFLKQQEIEAQEGEQVGELKERVVDLIKKEIENGYEY